VRYYNRVYVCAYDECTHLCVRIRRVRTRVRVRLGRNKLISIKLLLLTPELLNTHLIYGLDGRSQNCRLGAELGKISKVSPLKFRGKS